MKRKYTKEQLEFYFKRLMEKIKRIPREEDMEKAKGSPSVTAYVERFGSWNNAVKMFANFDLAKKKCAECGQLFVRTKKNQRFCSDKCAKLKYAKKFTKYTKATEEKIKNILDNRCFICDFYHITEIHCLDNRPESNNKILRAYNKKELHDYVLLCPNHHQMIHQKLAKLYYKNDELYWEEF